MLADDTTLLALIASGDQDALHELYTAYRSRLRRYLWHQLGGDQREVDDLLQEVFLAIWRAAPNFRGEARVSTWIYQIAHHHVLHARRDRVRHPEREVVRYAGQHGTDDEDAVECAEAERGGVAESHEDVVLDRLLLEQAMECLSPKHREVLDLVFVHGFAPEEVAVILDVPGGTVRSRLSYARRALLQALARSGGGIEGTPRHG